MHDKENRIGVRLELNQTKISIWGSCVSRDIFNQKFVKNHKEIFHVVSDQQHISALSLMSKPILIKTDDLIGDVTPFYKNVFRQDMKKEYLINLKKTQPDIILIDFYTDAFYGTKKLKNSSYITNKIWQYKKLNVFNQLEIEREYSVYNNSLEFISLWKKSFDSFMAYVTEHLPNSKVVINSARFSNTYFDENEKNFKILSEKLTDKWSTFHIDRFNLIWELFDTYAIEKYKLDAITHDMSKYYCSSKHPWGLFYVHYNPEYYLDAFEKIRSVI